LFLFGAQMPWLCKRENVHRYGDKKIIEKMQTQKTKTESEKKKTMRLMSKNFVFNLHHFRYSYNHLCHRPSRSPHRHSR